tara:strand:- start:1565 stop:1759 length:195 start_codon:yes stop_codon:yes gene_type:complete
VAQIFVLSPGFNVTIFAAARLGSLCTLLTGLAVTSIKAALYRDHYQWALWFSGQIQFGAKSLAY